MMRAGIPGLIALLVLTLGVIRALWRTPAPAAGLRSDAGMMPALLAMQVVWYLTWIPGSEQGIVTGLAMAMAAMPLAGRRSAPTPARSAPGHACPPAEGRS